MTILHSVCSHERKLQFGDLQQGSECHPLEYRVSPVMFGCSCSRKFMDWLMARESGGIVYLLLEPCVSVLRRPQQGCHGIIGVAVDDIAGVGHEVWEQAINVVTLEHWEVGKILQSRSHASS